MRKTLAISFLLFFSALSHALFLAGWNEDDGKISILCEGEREVFISTPDGGTVRLSLDSASQSEFTPNSFGPYSIQCGALAKTVKAGARQSASQKASSNEGLGLLVLALSGVFIAALLAVSALMYLRFSAGRTEFVKEVRGRTVRLTLRAGERMSGVKISDPVFMGHSGGPLEFSLHSLMQGQAWSYEYEIEQPSRALPATLEATTGKDRFSAISHLVIGGQDGDGQMPARKKEPEGKARELRKLPKSA